MSHELSGLRLWITRPHPAAQESVARWMAAGALARAVPTVELRGLRLPPDAVPRLTQMLREGWVVLTSANAARFLMDAAALHPALRALLRERPAACIGEATARAARSGGYLVQHVAARATGGDLARELVEARQGNSFLLPGSDLQRPDVELNLRAHGAEVAAICVYETAPVRELAVADADDLRAKLVDAVALYSPSAAAGLVRGAAGCGVAVAQLPPALALGPTTAATAEQQGLVVAAQADDPAEEALLAEAARWWAARA